VVSARRAERGYALLAALLVLFLLSTALAILGTSLQLRIRLVRDDGQKIILGALSDAALAEALANLAQSPDYTGAPEHDFGGGRIASRVTSLGPGSYRVVATAAFAGRKSVVEAAVAREPGRARVTSWARRPG
jgi:type II secretory pathway component PulK